jgi:hypothetical protein
MKSRQDRCDADGFRQRELPLATPALASGPIDNGLKLGAQIRPYAGIDRDLLQGVRTALVHKPRERSHSSAVMRPSAVLATPGCLPPNPFGVVQFRMPSTYLGRALDTAVRSGRGVLHDAHRQAVRRRPVLNAVGRLNVPGAKKRDVAFISGR